MISELIDGISIKINEAFGDGYRIYSEIVAQGLQEPCFFISALDPSLKQLLGNRHRAQNPFVVHFFPAGSDKNIECHRIAMSLYAVLERISFAGAPVRGTQMRYTISDEVLQFFVSYNLVVTKHEAAAEKMQTLTVNNNVGG